MHRENCTQEPSKIHFEELNSSLLKLHKLMTKFDSLVDIIPSNDSSQPFVEYLHKDIKKAYLELFSAVSGLESSLNLSNDESWGPANDKLSPATN